MATATSTSSSTATGTFTALPSTNITVIYVTTTYSSIGKGQAAAIGFSAIFGFVVLCGCCGFIFLRKRPAKPDEIVRHISVAERRKSALEIRTAQQSTV
jgi:histidinol phosphatase-like PHP family hydrolase